MNEINIHSFKWTEMVNDSKGRSSPSKFIGVLSCLVSLSCFTLSSWSILIVLWFTNGGDKDFTAVLAAFQSVIMQSLALFAMGTALIATNRLSKDREVKLEEKAPE